MNLSPAPKTPLRTPQSVTATKNIQLTPIWEEVVKNNRLPSDVNQDLIFKEISLRLEDLEWPVRQHAFRVLYDIISIVSNDKLDERIIQNNILNKLIINLGHPAPGIRRVALETIQKYLKQTSQSEKILENYLQYGVMEKDLISNDQAGILRENITMATIMSLIDVIKPFIMPQNGGYVITQNFLTEIVEALVNQIKNPHYRDGCLETLWKLGEMVGKEKFYKTLDSLSERGILLNLLNLETENKVKKNEKIEEMNWSDETKSEASLENGNIDLFELNYKPRRFNNNYRENSYIISNESSEDFTDGTDTDTYTKESTPNDVDDFYPTNLLENNCAPSFVPIDNSNEKMDTGDIDEKTSVSKILLEAEIQLAEDKAINMKLLEEEEDCINSTSLLENSHSEKRYATNDGELIMKVLPNTEEIISEEKVRTPRRVRFGGEVIKLRTPDSDTTDIIIEIQDFDSEKETSEEQMTTEETQFDECETKAVTHSQIPLPIAPATKLPRDITSARKPRGRPISVNVSESESSDSSNKDENSISKNVNFDLLLSSGSDSDSKDIWEEDMEGKFWQWSELGLIEENLLNDLKNEENWKIQYQALGQLKLILINPKTIEKIGKPKNSELLNSIFKCLLYNFLKSKNHQVTTLALSIASHLIETLPKDVIRLNVMDIVRGLCRYVGGSRNVNLKIDSIQSLKTLFEILKPSSVIDVLISDECLFSPHSKLRENSLLAIMYATMTFPSVYFDVDKILEKVVDSAADVRRRVRHAALETIAVLTQFCSPKALTDNIARVTNKLSTPEMKAQLVAAIQNRLSRRILPSISDEGLVLYALQIPASRRFGTLGNPMGADVDWILSGTGSLSTGSAKSKIQLNAAAQRIEPKSTSPILPSKWSQSEEECLPSEKKQKNKPRKRNKNSSENPWTRQKKRNDSTLISPKNDLENVIFKAKSLENLTDENDCKKKINLEVLDYEKNGKILVRHEDTTWALVPMPTSEELFVSRDKVNGGWEESNSDAVPSYYSHSLESIRPSYQKIQSGNDLSGNKNSVDVKRYFQSHETSSKNFKNHNQGDFTEIGILTPSLIRDKKTDAYYQNGNTGKNESRGSNESTTRIPVLRKSHKPPRISNERKSSEPDENYKISTKISGSNINGNGYAEPSTFLPNIHSTQAHSNCNSKKLSLQIKYNDIDEIKLMDTTNLLSGLLSDRNVFSKDYSGLPNGVASAPAVINTEPRNETPSTSSSNSTDFGTLSGSGLRRFTTKSGASELNIRPPYRQLSMYESKLKNKKTSFIKNGNKVGITSHALSDSLKPFDRPKEALETCLEQLESQQWEVNILGLASLIRLLRHHPAIVLSQLHSIVVALGRQIKNLRSQVARAACQASAEMFFTLKRNVETDLDELSGPLFHRCADTNRFIRADCNDALDNMVDNVGYAKAVACIISKGTTSPVIIVFARRHQNATVRTVAARLLLRLTEKVGSEKLLSLPKEIREKMLQAGANLLTEGKLETRAFTKQIFRLWTSHPSFSHLMIEAVSPNVMRNINKTLLSIKS